RHASYEARTWSGPASAETAPQRWWPPPQGTNGCPRSSSFTLNLSLSVPGRTRTGNLHGRHNGEPVQRSCEMNVNQKRARTRAPIVRRSLARRFQALPAAGQVVEISADSQIEFPVEPVIAAQLESSAPHLNRRLCQQHVLATDLEHYRGGADRNTLSGRLERSQATLARQGFERVKVPEGDAPKAQRCLAAQVCAGLFARQPARLKTSEPGNRPSQFLKSGGQPGRYALQVDLFERHLTSPSSGWRREVNLCRAPPASASGAKSRVANPNDAIRDF